MDIKTIMCPIDFAEHGQAALNYAATLAESFGAKLHVVHVYDDRVVYEVGFGGAVAPPVDVEQIKQELEKIVPEFGLQSVEHACLTGAPADAIVDFATANDVDLIVMGTHGRRGLSRILIGSVAEAVMRQASCPVITIRDSIKELQSNS